MQAPLNIRSVRRNLTDINLLTILNSHFRQKDMKDTTWEMSYPEMKSLVISRLSDRHTKPFLNHYESQQSGAIAGKVDTSLGYLGRAIPQNRSRITVTSRPRLIGHPRGCGCSWKGRDPDVQEAQAGRYATPRLFTFLRGELGPALFDKNPFLSAARAEVERSTHRLITVFCLLCASRANRIRSRPYKTAYES